MRRAVTNSRYCVTAAAVLIVAAALLAGFGAAARPAVMKFGQYVPLSGLLSPLGSAMRDGAVAAVKEANDAGGVGGTRLELYTVDDGYVPTRTRSLVEDMLTTHPDMVALVAGIGSPTTAALIPVVQANQIANVGPSTGSSVFRIPYYEQMINVRAGYDDEAYTMMYILLNVLKKRRIALFYQNDAFGAPATNAIIAAMPRFGLEPVAVKQYLSSNDVSTFDFATMAREIAAERPEAIIMYATGPWCVGMLRELKPLVPDITSVTGSWVGATLNSGMRAAGVDPSNTYVTQTFPSPNDLTSPLVRRYRAALEALNGTSANFGEFFALEGYVSVRMMIEIANRTVTGTRSDFLDTVFKTRMFEVDGLIAGPYERSCSVQVENPAYGRSSLCRCTQGFRNVNPAIVTSSYEFAPFPAGDRQYSLAYCYPTAETAVSPIAVAGLLASTDTVVQAAAGRGLAGLELAQRGAMVRALDFTSGTTTSGSASAPLFSAAVDQAVSGLNLTALLMPMGMSTEELANRSTAARAALMLDPVMVPQLPWGTAFDRSRVALTATLEQQLYATAEHVRAKLNGAPLSLIVSDRVSPADAAVVQGLFADTLRTVGLASGSASLNVPLSSAGLAPFQSASGAYFVLGVTTEGEMTALLTLLDTRTSMELFFAFDELSVTYNAIVRCLTSATCSRTRLPYQIHYSSNVAPWLNVTEAPGDDLTAAYTAAHTGSLADRHPLEMRGMMVGLAARSVTERLSLMAPAEFASALYGASVLAVPGRRLGPYSDTLCRAAECRCNSGAGEVTTRSLWYLSSVHPSADPQWISRGPSTASSATTTTFNDCRIAYTPIATSETSYLGVAVAVPIVAVAVIVACYLLLRYLGRPNRYAPTNCDTPITIAYLALRGMADVQETDAGRVAVFKKFGDHVRRSARRHECHVAHKVGDFFAVVSEDPATLAAFVDATSAEFEMQDWSLNVACEVLQRHDGAMTSVSGTSGGSPSTVRGSETRHPSLPEHRKSLAASNAAPRAPSSGGAPRRRRNSKHTDNSSTNDRESSGGAPLRRHKSKTSGGDGRATRKESMARDGGSNAGHTRHVGRLTIALHYGRCAITHDEHVDAYEYRGAPMTLCAQLLDACANGQFLATEDYQETLMDAMRSDCGDRLTTVEGLEKMQDSDGRVVECLQYNVGGVVKTFKRTEGSEQVESAAAAADQATGLLTRKRVTVAAVRVGSLQDVTNRTGDAVTAAYTTLHESLAACARVHRGHVHAVVGDLVIVSFNAARPASEQGRRALQLCNNMFETFVDDRNAQGRVTCGIAIGSAYVGTAVDGSVAIVGSLMQEALNLEHASRTLRSPADIVVSDEHEFGKTAALQWVGLAPAKAGDRQFPRRGVLAVAELHDDADEGEWLYLLQQREGRCKNLNDAFRDFAETGDGARALEAATEAAQEEKNAPDGDEDDNYSAEALVKLAKAELARLARERLGDGDSPAARALTMA